MTAATADAPPDAESTALTAVPPKLFLFDGECGLCDASVQRLLKIDRDGLFRFAPLQGETTARLREKHPEIPDNLSTVVYVENDRVYLRSRAFTTAAKHMPMPWRVLAIFNVVPAFLLDIAYRFVAKIRYRVWGKKDMCRIPSKDERSRFLP